MSMPVPVQTAVGFSDEGACREGTRIIQPGEPGYWLAVADLVDDASPADPAPVVPGDLENSR